MRTLHRIAAGFSLLLTPLALYAQPASATPAATAAANPAGDRLVWPARLAVASGLKPETLALKGEGWRPMGTIEPISGRLSELHLGSWESPSATKGQKEDWSILTARLVEKLPDAKPHYETTGAFLFVPAFSDEPVPSAASSPAFTFRFISARPPAPAKKGAEPTVTIERTWFSYYEPLPPKPVPGEPAVQTPQTPRALVVFMPGMFGTPSDQIVALIKRLRQEGYAVLRMLSQPSRFTESTTYALPLEGDLTSLVPPIASDLTDRAAEAGYAVESAVMYVYQERPGLRKLPRFAVGMSGGAMLLPIVLAREPGSYAGAVSIAGGVDYLRILTTSNYTNWIDAVRVAWTTDRKAAAPADGSPPELPSPSAKRLDELSAVYRAAAPLDSANLAPRLKNIPWLILHATSDKAVPASTGEELWELLGKPERITVKGGHEWIFMIIGARFNAISDWLNKRAPKPAEPAP